MNIAGLNNMLIPQSKTTSSAKGQPLTSAKEGQKTGAFGEMMDVKTDKKVVAEKSLDPGSLPGQDSPSHMDSPMVSDRLAMPPSPVSVKPNLTKELTGPGQQDQDVDSLTRRVVWTDFLRKMKNQFGVSAEDILKAFATLSEKDLAKPPEQTVDKVVMALGLNPQQSMLAKQYFQELIAKTKSSSLGEELARSGSQIDLTLMSQRELQHKAMERSLERMNQNFFMKDAVRTPNAPPTGPLKAAENPHVKSAEPAVSSKEPQTSPLTMPPAESLPAALNSLADSDLKLDGKDHRPTTPASVKDILAKMKPADSSDQKSVDNLIKKFTNTNHQTHKAEASLSPQNPLAAALAKASSPNVSSANEAMAAGMNAPQVLTPNGTKMQNAEVSGAAAGPSMPKLTLPGLAGQGASDDGQDDSSSDPSNSPLAMATVVGADGKPHHVNLNGPDFQTRLAQQAPQGPQPVTVPELIQNARIMVRDGGGDMKVTLHPDGLGQVAMRVSVDHGKVNVQMITESDEAKKLIQRELSDLKTQLASHHLQVSDIKVDTATNLGRQLEQQYHDAQRQATQMAWEQFRQDNQGWKRSFFEVPSARQYKGVESAPHDGSIPATASARSRRLSDRRLDLVA